MALLSFNELWTRLTELDETIEVEVKECHQSLGKSVLETISAFSNEPSRGGGYLILGIKRNTNVIPYQYEKIGIANPDKLQADLAGQCREEFSTPVRPIISVESEAGKVFLVVFIPESQPTEKPVYIKTRGLPKGAFRRIGSTDQSCTQEDLEMFFQLRSHQSYDETPITGTSLDDFDSDAIAVYRRLRAQVNPTASELAYSDEELLFSLAATTRHNGEICASLGGLLLFGKSAAIRRYFPMCRIDYMRVQGKEWVPDAETRFQTTVEISGCLLNSIPRAISTVLDDIPKTFSLSGEDIYRKDIPLVPQNVIREAIVNALMHRNYRMKQPVQIIRFANRLEIRNPGHSLVPDERLGEPGSVSRNEKIAAVLHEVGFAETKGSGIKAMRSGMDKAHLTPPIFESDRHKDSFTVTLLTHNLIGEEEVKWLTRFNAYNLTEEEAMALLYTREVGFINNATYRELNHVDTLTASQRLCRLRDAGLLVQDGKGSATYYYLPPHYRQEEPGSAGLGLVRIDQGLYRALLSSSDNALETPLSSSHKELSPEFNLGDKSIAINLEGVPEALSKKIKSLGKRSKPQEVRLIIQAICSYKPFSASELALILGRDQGYILKHYLRPMINDKTLHYLYPSVPHHPEQAYKSATSTPSSPQ